MKILCTSRAKLPRVLPSDTLVFSFFEASDLANIGRIAIGWPDQLKHQGYAPDLPPWDFMLICFAVCAADFHCPRMNSPDGWTRQLQLSITVNDPQLWSKHKELLERMFRVLTGDFWSIVLLDGGPRPPRGQRRLCDRDCVALLSGGLDSLIGGINLQHEGRAPIFVSQLAHEDSERQRVYAAQLGGGNWHQQWSHKIGFPGVDEAREPSTRARSLAFYGLAVVASTLVSRDEVDLIVAENGFISLNPPLLPRRMASLSTRTTHPVFMSMLQELFAGVGLNVRLQMPYKYMTKGEMLVGCLDQAFLHKFAADTTSCGRYRTYNRTHCGRCVPCMVRKASFVRWDANSDVTEYVFPGLAASGKSSDADDPMAVACAILEKNKRGIDRFLSASIAFAQGEERRNYRAVIDRGLGELEVLLKRDNVL